MRFVLLVLLGGASLTVASASAAPGAEEGPGDPEGGKVAAKAAREAFDRGDFPQAIAGFQEAFQRDPRSVYLFWVAHIQEQADQVEAAIDTFRRFLKADPASPKRKTALKRVEQLTRRLDREKPQVAFVSEPTGARLQIDGAAVGTTPWRGRLKAGAHTVTLSLEGHRPLQDAVVVELSHPLTRRFELQPLTPAATEPAATEPAATEPTPAPAPADDNPLALYGWIALGTGAAATAVGGVFLYLWQAEEEEVTSARNIGVRRQHEDIADRDVILAQVMGGLALAGFGAGALLLLMPPDEDAQISLAPAFGGLTATVRF